jgi:hypothetical protein
MGKIEIPTTNLDQHLQDPQLAWRLYQQALTPKDHRRSTEGALKEL